MSIGQISNSLLNTLRRNKEIFDSSSEYLLYKNPDLIPFSIETLSGYTFYFPKQINRDEIGGLKLKDGKGYISISETYKTENTRDYTKIAHVYRYITDEFSYECKSRTGEDKKIPYNFHYDMDLHYDTLQHPPKHLQVLHSHPRFPVEDESVDEFILRVKVTCFDTDLNPLTTPLYL